MNIAYVGNFDAEHSTENHVRIALEYNGHTVDRYQENNLNDWYRLPSRVKNYDFVLWTRTGWNPPIPEDTQCAVINMCCDTGIPIVGYHLDRWWGLNREDQVRNEPFFRSNLVITADGGHEEQFKEANVNHVWFPPGVSLQECERTPQIRSELSHELVFCGSWNSYHAEWGYRLELCNWLQSTYSNRITMYPRLGHHALRGQDLVDLYYNSKVMVGDSCLSGNITNYWSDRIPETLGRGGFLIHPGVEGLQNHFTPGEHLVTYTMGDWDQLQELIEYYSHHDEERQAIVAAGKKHVMETATYEVRMEQLVGLLKERGMLN